MNFFECFEDFDCDQSRTQTTSSYIKFNPCYHNKNWFLDHKLDTIRNNADSINEKDLYRACSYVQSQEYDNAMQIFTNMYETTKNNRFHTIMLIDSILQCHLKSPNADQTACLELLEKYEELLVDFGDQIQYLRTKAEILARFDNDFSKFINTISLLCSLSDLPENWLLFGALKSLETKLSPEKLKNVNLAYRIHALHCYKWQLDQAHGFVKEKIAKKIVRLEDEINNLESDEKKIQNIAQYMSYSRREDSNEQTDSSEFRAHDCRAKNRFIDKMHQKEIVSNFCKKYQFLFDNLV